MSQNSNENMYFTNLPASNQYTGSSYPSSPSSQNSNSSSPQMPPYGTQLPPEAIYQNQQFAFEGFANYPQRPVFQSQPQFFNPSQPLSFPPPPSEPQFKVPADREPSKRRGKKSMAKRKTKKFMSLDDDDDDLEAVAQVAKRNWSRDEEKLLAEIWIEISQDKDIGNDRSDEAFWNQILDMFNDQSDREPRSKNMITGKWTRLNSDCQKFNAIYKQLQRRSGENDGDHIKNAKENFELRFSGRKFAYVHVWDILKKYPKWDAEDPINISCLEDIFGPDRRPRPDGAYKVRAAKKQKSTSTSSAASSCGSQTSSYSGSLSEKYSQKVDVQISAYETRMENDWRTLKMEEMKFLMIGTDNIEPAKAAIIRRRQKEIMKKYQINEDEDAD